MKSRTVSRRVTSGRRETRVGVDGATSRTFPIGTTPGAWTTVPGGARPDDAGRHVHVRTGCEADRARHLADLRELVALDRSPETVETQRRQFFIGGVEDHNELLAAKAEQPIAAAKCLAHELAHAQQHFIAEQVAERVIHALEMIDIDDA